MGHDSICSSCVQLHTTRRNEFAMGYQFDFCFRFFSPFFSCAFLVLFSFVLIPSLFSSSTTHFSFCGHYIIWNDCYEIYFVRKTWTAKICTGRYRSICTSFVHLTENARFIYIYIYIYICLCQLVCLCVCVWERERDGSNGCILQ